jgi:hypothetical protein
MTIAHHTGATELCPCSKCDAEVLHREVVALSHGADVSTWSPEPHAAPCGQPCFGAGATSATKPWQQMHGWGDRCPKCGPLRVLSEVVDEMRAHVEWVTRFVSADPVAAQAALRTVAKNLGGALTEIEKLTAERDKAEARLDAALEQNRALQMRLDDVEIAADEAKGEVR